MEPSPRLQCFLAAALAAAFLVVLGACRPAEQAQAPPAGPESQPPSAEAQPGEVPSEGTEEEPTEDVFTLPEGALTPPEEPQPEETAEPEPAESEPSEAEPAEPEPDESAAESAMPPEEAPPAEEPPAAPPEEAPPAEPETLSAEAPAEEPAEAAPPEEIRPLVDRVGDLELLHPKYPAWFDKKEKAVVLVGEVCQTRAPLELFACLRGSKEHESVVVVDTKAYVVHAGLIAAGAEPGNPVQFYPEYIAATGPEVEITVRWKDSNGKLHTARAQEWVRNVKTEKAMEEPWVFAGSQFVRDEETKLEYYRGDTEGDLICVSNFPSAVLDVPVQSSDSDSALLFEAYTEHIPPRGTPVTLVLKPKPKAAAEDKPTPPEAAPSGDAEAERQETPEGAADKPAPEPPAEPEAGAEADAEPADGDASE